MLLHAGLHNACWLMAPSGLPHEGASKPMAAESQSLDTLVSVCLQGCQPVRRWPSSEHYRHMGAGLVARRPHHPQVLVAGLCGL